ncbi:hypothetical protein D0Z08_17180 [Nocardioides immobilis]|uniref:Uncharacterized protein n=1 Tax=Nocardioides immobilis TaxID=2049295 RepID=A0A417XZJ6_9ACTN|nr:hypothetical protein [Nocardioides immobilis]RHW25781.1 hypothetical protein D0Z08_17180 [Nocardioides immobilis]
MRLHLRSHLATLVPLLLLLPTAVLTGGCSGDSDADDDGPSVVATGPDEQPTDEGTDGTSDPTDEPTDEPTSAPPDLPDAVAAVCTPYAEMVSAIKEAADSTTDRDAVAATIGPVMKEFAAQVPDLRRPPGLSERAWRGVGALAELVLELPDEPTYAEIEAVEGKLSPDQREAVGSAFDWFQSNCGL